MAFLKNEFKKADGFVFQSPDVQKWYLKNTDWIDNILSGEYRNWIENNYDKR